MNTDKLMELERKWPLDRHPDPHTDAWTLGYLRAKRECADELAAALRAEQAVGTARQSEGMVLVPREPTEAMKAAGAYSKWNYDDAADIYRAMLAAAPGGEGEG